MAVRDGAAAGAVWIGVGVFRFGGVGEGDAGFAVCVCDETGGICAGGDGGAVCADAGGLPEVQQPEADLSVDGDYRGDADRGVCDERYEWGASLDSASGGG